MKPLRILMVIHTPWRSDLGAPQAQMELAAIFRSRGHEVSKFSLEDAFPQVAPQSSRHGLMRLVDIVKSNRSFARRVRRYLRRNGAPFDIIDANQTDLPYPKQSLGFGGLLVARSVGLIPLYSAFEAWARRQWPVPLTLRDRAKLVLTAPVRHRRERDALRSLAHADVINVSNSDELRYVASTLGLGRKTIHVPLGLSDQRREALFNKRGTPSDRLAAQEVVFIGSWDARKGARDWPRIVRLVRAHEPSVRFVFLGTAIPAQRVLCQFAPEDQAGIHVVERFDSAELPARLARSTVGAFPGYLEGFGLGVLEMLAAGLPVVAYNAPGPRDMLTRLRVKSMVPLGGSELFAEALRDVLGLTVSAYADRSSDSARVAREFSWPMLASRTLDAYQESLQCLHGATR